MLLLALLIALSNGWEAKVHFTHDPPRKSGGADGAIHLSQGRVRLEEPTAIGLTVILFSGGRTRLLFPERKQFMEIAPAEAALSTVPPLSLEGMKQVGEERVGGRDCIIWEKTLQTAAGRVRQRLWVPSDAPKKPLVFLRFVTQTDRGATKADLSDLHEAPQPATLFKIPVGYAKK
jgi:hypothetical protein